MVMPLWDDSPLKLPRLPLVTWGLIVANVVVFALEAAAPESVQATFDAFAVTPANITGTPINPTPVPPYLALVTYMFLHANFWHLAGNMIFLWVFGDDVEEAMGPLRFVAFYIGSGIVAALAFTATAPHSQLPLVGASGAIAGVLAAYLMFRPCQKLSVFVPYILLWFVIRPVVRIDAFWVLGAWILMQIWSISVQAQDGVAYMAHVGGLISGAALFPLLRYRAVRLFECFRAVEEPPSPQSQVS
jgi:membrane associated rhomboid family serine protease